MGGHGCKQPSTSPGSATLSVDWRPRSKRATPLHGSSTTPRTPCSTEAASTQLWGASHFRHGQIHALRSVSIRPLRTEGREDLAVVWTQASWVSGPEDQPTTVEVRGMLVWRKEPDGVWRVAMEHIG